MADELTAQEIFDTVARHLLKQGKRSMKGEHCAYRGDGDTACAVGCLMTDDESAPELEGSSVEGLVSRGALPNRLRPHARLLGRLQRVHDEVEYNDDGDVVAPNAKHFKKRLAALAATTIGLSAAVLDEVAP